MKYRIHWESISTGATGYGNEELEESVAKKLCREQNVLYGHIMHHWIEPVEESDQLTEDWQAFGQDVTRELQGGGR